MIQEKVNSARQSGITDIKFVNAVKKDNFMCVFNFPEDMYDSAWAQATGEEDPWIIREQSQIDYKRATHQKTIWTAAVVSTQLILVNQGALHSK